MFSDDSDSDDYRKFCHSHSLILNEDEILMKRRSCDSEFIIRQQQLSISNKNISSLNPTQDNLIQNDVLNFGENGVLGGAVQPVKIDASIIKKKLIQDLAGTSNSKSPNTGTNKNESQKSKF